ncbi:hypothetical protein AAVH_35883 [Aphelenchoides avenae]|nr:hypothetical protein AAVH_35883 [Aphelenchus avenae]
MPAGAVPRSFAKGVFIAELLEVADSALRAVQGARKAQESALRQSLAKRRRAQSPDDDDVIYVGPSEDSRAINP